jgi:hypothetical protein
MAAALLAFGPAAGTGCPPYGSATPESAQPDAHRATTTSTSLSTESRAWNTITRTVLARLHG